MVDSTQKRIFCYSFGAEIFLEGPMPRDEAKLNDAAQIPQLAYKSGRFLDSGDARTLRILAEYLEPQARLRRAGVQNTVVMFGSARILAQDVAEQQLRELEARA